MATALGTLEWTRETRGVLRARDRWSLVGQACLYGLAVLPWEIRRALGITHKRATAVDEAAIQPPDSTAAREAEELIGAFAPPMVVQHGHRTFSWGAALAAHDGRTFDREVMYVASLLHDLYWSAPDALHFPHCFTLPAAEDAIALAGRAGWDEQRANATANAITLHLNVMPPQTSHEAYYVFVGARLDVIGYRYWDLHRDTIDVVLARHPRLDLKRESFGGFDRQAETNPGTRVHFETRYLASKWFCKHAPFDE